MEKRYVIPGKPVPLRRPRVYNKRAIDTQKDIKLAIQHILRIQQGNTPPYKNKPLLMDITFFMPLPKSKKKRRQYLEQRYHTHKPDLDNLVKMVCDCATMLYNDDCVIGVIHARKVYDENPRTEFELRKALIDS